MLGNLVLTGSLIASSCCWTAMCWAGFCPAAASLEVARHLNHIAMAPSSSSA
jgi:hypothetical protein